LTVISEFLRAQERVNEIDKQHGTDRQAQNGFEIHPRSPHWSFSQPRT